MNKPGDVELVGKSLDGNPQAFGELIDRYQKVIFNAALRIVNDYEDAKDTTQAVFVKAFENLSSFDSRYKFFSWIYRFAVNEALNVVHRRRQTQPLDEDIRCTNSTPEELLHQHQLDEQIDEALAGLSSDYRLVVVMKYFLEMSLSEIAEIIHVEEKTVKSRLYTARQHLCEALTKRGITAHED